MDLNFEITYQKLTRKDNSFVVSHSQNYLYAVFNYISDDWKNDVNKKYAIFQDTSSNDSYTVEISNDECIVPAEVLKNNSFYVSVIGTNDSSKVIVTTNKIYITLNNGAELSELYPEDPEMPLIPSILERLDKTFIDLSYSFDKESKTLTTMITLNDKANNKITRNVIINLDDNDRYIENISMDWEHKQLVFTFNDKKVINVPFNIDYSYIENTPTKLSEFTNDENFVKQTDLNNTLTNYTKKTELNDTLQNYAQKNELPTKTSDLTNDSGFITKLVEDLVNYYKKSEIYNKEEIDQRISAIPKFNVKVVVSLPISNISTTTLYLLKTGDESQNLYTEFIYVDGVWERLGTQTLDLSGYATQEWVISKNYLTKENLSGYATEDWVSSKNYITSESLNGYATEDWVNNKNYAVKTEIPTNVSQLVNDSNYQNDEQVKQLIKNNEQITNVDIDCDHEYEITGKTGHEYGVAIEDSQMLLKKIQGQTRRYSLNLLNLPDMAETTKNGVTCSVSNGVVKVKGTNTASSDVTFSLAENMQFFGNDFSMDVGYDFTQLNNVNKFYVILSKTSYESIMLFNFNNNIHGFATKNNLNEVSRLSVIIASGQEVDITLTPMLVSGIYTKDTMPPFQPYDDTLVNSKCNLVSTGRNLLRYKTTNGKLNGLNYSFNGNIVRIKGTATADTSIYSDMNELLLNGSYYWRPNANKENYMPCAILYNNTTIQDLNNYSDILITLTNTKVNRMLWYIPSGTTIDYEANIMLNYGNQPSEYEPYTQEELPINVELGAYDYIDNVSHLLVKQTSDIITLDGSSDEYWSIADFTDKLGKKVFTYGSVNGTNVPIVCNKIKTYDYSYLDEGGHGLGINASYNIRIYGTDFTTIEEFNTWLSQNPIQISYKLATPTTEQLLLPAGYAVYTGGLQQQVIEGKYLPYILTKQYPVSNSSQILANMEMNRTQQDQIDQNTSDISNIKKEFSDLSVMVESTEESLISGVTGSEYGLALKDVENPLVTKIYGKTRRYSLNLLNLPDMAETTKNGVTCSVSNGVVKVKGTNTASSDVTFSLAENMQFFGNDFSMDVGYDFTQLNNVNKFYVILSKTSYESIMLFNFNNNIHGFATKNNLNEVSRLSVIIASGQEVDITLTPMLVSGIYTKDTMPPFQPYDDTLVNSKASLISTGKNLFNSATVKYGYYGGGSTRDSDYQSDYIPCLPNSTYTISGTVNNFRLISVYDSNKEKIGLVINNTNAKQFTTPSNASYFMFSSNSATHDEQFSIMIVYGNTAPSEYEPYKQDTMQIDVELGENDYIDNEANLIVRQQSDIITLDGSSDENWFVSAGTGNYVLQLPSDSLAGDSAMSVTNNSLFSVASNGFVKANATSFDSVDTLKTYLQSNPIQVSYKLATPTTEPITLAAGYIVYPNGLQHQVVSEGKHLPYSKIVKKYAISSRSQILHVIEINKDQQAEINELKNKNSSSSGLNLFRHTISLNVYSSQDKTDLISSEFKMILINTNNEQISINNIENLYRNSISIFHAEDLGTIQTYGLFAALQFSNSFNNLFAWIDIDESVKYCEIVSDNITKL